MLAIGPWYVRRWPPLCRQSDGRSERRERSHDALKTARFVLEDLLHADRGRTVWRKLPQLGSAHVENIIGPRQCHVAHDDGLAGVFVSAAENVVGAPG